MSLASVVIVSPALAGANNGNWQTARRWRQFLSGDATVRITGQWPDAAADEDEVMLALHARRSAASIAAWAERRGGATLAVVLTGTDLYQDIATDDAARRSLAVAGQLVVLQSLAREAVPAAWRHKTQLVYQSTTSRAVLPKTHRELRAIMVGHLRAVKSPETLFDAARLLRDDAAIRISHIGDAAEGNWRAQALATAAACPAYRWLGPLPHARTRQAIQRAHVLVHTSAMEGGAHVIMEACCSGTPVLASRVPGNVGMLGQDYAGYFAHGDAAGLAGLLRRCREAQAGEGEGLLAQLQAQCRARAPLFAPEAERAALRALVARLRRGS